MERYWGTLRWIGLGLVAVWLIWSGTSGGGSTMPEPGSPAVPFEVPAAGGTGDRTVRLEAHRGRPVVLVFFATWCSVCREELPAIQRTVERHPGLDVLLLSDEDPGTLSAWLTRHRIRLSAGGGAREALRAYGVRLLPSAVVVGADGRVVYAGQGATGVSRALREALRAAERQKEAGLRKEDGVFGESEGGKHGLQSTCRRAPILC